MSASSKSSASPTYRWSAARTRRSARCIASSRARACACRTASPSPPRRTATCSRRPAPGDQLHAALDDLDPTTWRTWPGGRKRAREIVYGAGVARGPGQRDSRRLPAPAGAVRRGREPRGAQLRDRRGPADRELRRPAGHAISTSTASESLLDACRRCFASLFTDRAIHYRIDQGFDHFKVALSIGVMKMVRSDLAALGRDLLARHRVRLPRRRLHHRRLRPGRERGAGRRRPGRVLRAQADLRVRPPRRAAPRCSADKAIKMVYVEGGDQAHDPQRPDPEGRPRALLHQRRGRARAGRLRDQDREPLRPTDGHGVGQGRPRRQALHRAGATRDGRLPARGHVARDLRRSTARGELLAEGRSVGEKIATGNARLIANVDPPGGVQARRGAGRRHHHARLGAGDEDRGGDRHQPRRPHLPRGDRRARARHPCRRRRRQRHHRAPERRCRSRSPAPRATSGGSTAARSVRGRAHRARRHPVARRRRS